MYLAYLSTVTFSFLSTIIGVSGTPHDLWLLHRRGHNTWQRYGAPLLLALRGAVDVYMHIDFLLGASDEDLMAYKDAYLNECNMVAVAAAIIAQVALTALQFDSISRVSWTARGAFVFSLVSGCFSVYAACTQQRLVTNLTRPNQLRAWLTADPRPEESMSQPQGSSDVQLPFHTSPSSQPSVPAVLTLTAPRTLLDCAMRCFLVGLGIYLTFMWTDNLNPDSTRVGNLNMMVAYTVAVLVGVSLFISPSSNRNFSIARERELRLQQQGHEAGGAHVVQHASALTEKGVRTVHISSMQDDVPSLNEIEQVLRASAAAHLQSAEALTRAADMYRGVVDGREVR